MNVSPTVRQVQRLQPLHRRVTELYPCSRSFEAFTKDPTPLLGSHEAAALATHCSPVVVAAPLGQPRLDVKALRLLEAAPGWDPGQALTASASDLKLHGTALGGHGSTQGPSHTHGTRIPIFTRRWTVAGNRMS